MIDLLDSLLKRLGLMRIKRAEHIVAELVACRERTLVVDVWNDFHVPSKPGFEEVARQWAIESFQTANEAITEARPDIVNETEYMMLMQGYDVPH